MAQSLQNLYSTKWVTKNISEGIYGATEPFEVFQSIAIAESDNAYKKYKIDSQVLTITFASQAEPSQDTQLVTHEIRASEFENLNGLLFCFNGLLGVSAKIENEKLVIESDTPIFFSEDEPVGLIDALGLHAEA